MKPVLIIVVLLFSYCFSFGQAGHPFPVMQAKNLEDKAVSIPGDLKDKKSVVCLVYSAKTEKALSSWLKPLINTFLVKNPLDIDPYDVNLCFIVMLSGIKDLASDVVIEKFKKNVDKSFYKNIIIYQGSLKPYIDELSFGKKDEPYFCVIDKKGVIMYSTVGMYSSEKLEEIESKIVE